MSVDRRYARLLILVLIWLDVPGRAFQRFRNGDGKDTGNPQQAQL